MSYMMSMLKEIEEKLSVAKKEVKQLASQKELCLAINKGKYNPPDDLSPEEKSAISRVVGEYLGQEQERVVLSRCFCFRLRSEVTKPRRDNLEGLKQRGRPKGSSDYAAKELINSLAKIWQEAGKTLPRQAVSPFGFFVKDIAKALKVKEVKSAESEDCATWAGQVNDVLRGEEHARIRTVSDFNGGLPWEYEAKLDAVAGNDWKERIARERSLFVGAAHKGIEMALDNIRVRAEIDKIPGIEKFTVVIKRKKM